MTEIGIKKLRDKCLLFNQFMINKGGVPSQLADAFERSNELIEKAYKEGEIKPLRSMSADIDEQVRHMPLAMALEIERIFKENLDIVIDNSKIIDAIVKRGKIRNEDEFRFIENEVSELCQTNIGSPEIDILKKMLIVFYEKMGGEMKNKQ